MNTNKQIEDGGAAKNDWVKCPICGEPDTRKEFVGGRSDEPLIFCANHACGSNGGTNFSEVPIPYDLTLSSKDASLRDMFAAKALAGALGNPTFWQWIQNECQKGGRGSMHQLAAQSAYAFADAMIAARKGGV